MSKVPILRILIPALVVFLIYGSLCRIGEWRGLLARGDAPQATTNPVPDVLVEIVEPEVEELWEVIEDEIEEVEPTAEDRVDTLESRLEAAGRVVDAIVGTNGVANSFDGQNSGAKNRVAHEYLLDFRKSMSENLLAGEFYTQDLDEIAVFVELYGRSARLAVTIQWRINEFCRAHPEEKAILLAELEQVPEEDSASRRQLVDEWMSQYAESLENSIACLCSDEFTPSELAELQRLAQSSCVSNWLGSGTFTYDMILDHREVYLAKCGYGEKIVLKDVFPRIWLPRILFGLIPSGDSKKTLPESMFRFMATAGEE